MKLNSILTIIGLTGLITSCGGGSSTNPGGESSNSGYDLSQYLFPPQSTEVRLEIGHFASIESHYGSFSVPTYWNVFENTAQTDEGIFADITDITDITQYSITPTSILIEEGDYNYLATGPIAPQDDMLFEGETDMEIDRFVPLNQNIIDGYTPIGSYEYLKKTCYISEHFPQYSMSSKHNDISAPEYLDVIELACIYSAENNNNEQVETSYRVYDILYNYYAKGVGPIGKHDPDCENLEGDVNDLESPNCYSIDNLILLWHYNNEEE